MADTPDSGADSQAQPSAPPPPPSKEEVFYPTIGTEKVTENGRKPGGTTRGRHRRTD